MTSWKKTNKTMLRIHYSMDKYRENEEGMPIETLEGELAYVNLPFASTFLNIEGKDGKMYSISRDCIFKIDWLSLPKWTKLTESHVVDSAKMRLKNLSREIEEEQKRFNSQEALDDMLDDHAKKGIETT